VEESTKQPCNETIENQGIESIAANVAKILSQVQDFTYKDKINNDLHKELQEYRQGLKESFYAPLLKAVVREYDRVKKQYCFYLEKSQSESESQLFNKLLSEFEILSFALLNLLTDFDIEQFDFNTGDTHDIKLQKIVEVIETDDPQKDGTVAECLVCGFRNIETARLFRQAEVKIYKQKK
jgi:molecular chaperone GrpE (heat shock protein)